MWISNYAPLLWRLIYHGTDYSFRYLQTNFPVIKIVREHTEVKINLKKQPPQKQSQTFPSVSAWPEGICTHRMDSNKLDFSQSKHVLGQHGGWGFYSWGMDKTDLRSNWWMIALTQYIWPQDVNGNILDKERESRRCLKWKYRELRVPTATPFLKWHSMIFNITHLHVTQNCKRKPTREHQTFSNSNCFLLGRNFHFLAIPKHVLSPVTIC